MALSDKHRRLVRNRGFTDQHIDKAISAGWLCSLTAEQIQSDWCDRFPSMRGNEGGAMLITFNETTFSLKADQPPLDKEGKPKKYLYVYGGDDPKGTHTQPWCPDGATVATEGFFDALAATILMGVPCCAVTAPSHLERSDLPPSVRVYFSDADVPYHHNSTLLPMVVSLCRKKGLKITHLPRNPGANYAYAAGKIPEECKWGAEEWHREWSREGRDSGAELKKLIAQAQEPKAYVRSLIEEFAHAGIVSPDNDQQITGVATAIAASTGKATDRESLVQLLHAKTKARPPWLRELISEWDGNQHSQALVRQHAGDLRLPPSLQGSKPHRADLQDFLKKNHSIRHNVVTKQVEIDGKPFDDIDLADQWLAHIYRIEIDKSVAAGAFTYIARSNPYNPISEFLQGLRRRDGLRLIEMSDLARAFGIAADDELSKEFLGRHLVGHVVRGLHAGDPVRAKHDQILVVLGDQGTRKSASIQALAPRGLYDSATKVPELESWNFLPKLNACWLFEFDECELMMRMRSADEFKGFVTRVDDRYTEKNSNLSTSHPRRAVLWGTSNDSEILNDHTGNRRVWIIRTGARRLDPNWIEENRDSIWATVLTWMDWGLSNYLPDDSLSAGLAAQRAQAATLSDPWADDIRNALERADIDPQVGVGQDVLLRRYLGKDPSAKDAKKEAVRLKDIITGVGFRTHDGQYRWEKDKQRYPTVNELGRLGEKTSRWGCRAVPCSSPVPSKGLSTGTPQMPWHDSDLKEVFQCSNEIDRLDTDGREAV